MKLILKGEIFHRLSLFLPVPLNPHPQMGSSFCIQGAPASMLRMVPFAQRLFQPVCCFNKKAFTLSKFNVYNLSLKQKPISLRIRKNTILATAGQLQPLDLTEENVNQVLVEAKSEGFGHHLFDDILDVVVYQFMQLFDPAVGITGTVELAELDGPFVKLRLKGRFWHKRSTVLARLGTYLQKRIPEILEVDIEDEAQLDDSPKNF
ncbi:hypothetical protein KI387_025390 [Taxus chinensis]|uniref:Uncharacterized protein n=1 Tax=Taxus chinensis TaxID=29808 RepID=A0AA38L7A4_TAXCH|nr:hypothetical protein KI387_025390 [Taxus chinensis]